MKNRISINPNPYGRLLFLIPVTCLLAITGCSSLDAGTEQKFHTSFMGQAQPQQTETGDPVATNRDWYQAID